MIVNCEKENCKHNSVSYYGKSDGKPHCTKDEIRLWVQSEGIMNHFLGRDKTGLICADFEEFVPKVEDEDLSESKVKEAKCANCKQVIDPEKGEVFVTDSGDELCNDCYQDVTGEELFDQDLP